MANFWPVPLNPAQEKKISKLIPSNSLPFFLPIVSHLDSRQGGGGGHLFYPYGPTVGKFGSQNGVPTQTKSDIRHFDHATGQEMAHNAALFLIRSDFGLSRRLVLFTRRPIFKEQVTLTHFFKVPET